jgi:NAD(P)H-hydrate epimerase
MPLRSVSVAQMREVDRLMIDEVGITLPRMMENAGRSLAALVRLRAGGRLGGLRVAVLAGGGNNGGGGLVAARHLTNGGADVRVALVHSPPLAGEVVEQQRAILARMGVAGMSAAQSIASVPSLLSEADVIVDALVGYSLRGAPRDPVASFIRAANAAPAPRIALDLPSGLPGDSGIPGEPTLRADATLTLAWPKAGLLTPGARDLVGDLYLADISVPAAVYAAVGVERGAIFAAGPLVRIRPVDDGWEIEGTPHEAW